MTSSADKVVLLDRDGTINVDHGYVNRLDDWELIDKAAEAIALLRSAGFRIAVVTNQSGIASGKYTMPVQSKILKAASSSTSVAL